MSRVLAAALAAVPLLAVATPAAAAPPEHIVQSECFDADIIYCYTIDRIVKTTTTPSGNEIAYISGTDTLMEMAPDGGVRFSDSHTYRARWVIKQGEFHVTRLRDTYSWVAGDSTCTTTLYYKVTSGKVQVEDFDTVCNF